jgi:hypothetical protein
LLSWTPATTALLLRASTAFDGGPFLDERRLRERLQALIAAGLVRAWSLAQAGGGLPNYYNLTPQGFQLLGGTETRPPSRAFFAEVRPQAFSKLWLSANLVENT